jgi:predicted HTH domain antitoxin
MCRLELAAHAYDHGQISLGITARISGLVYSDMIDELGRRGIAVIRLEPGELESEVAAFGT